MIGNMLYLSTCLDNIRRYYLMPCKSIADVEKLLLSHKDVLIDANVVYFDDLDMWKREWSRDGVDLALSECRVWPEFADSMDCSFKSASGGGRGGSHNFLVRCLFRYVPDFDAADAPDVQFIEIASVVQAQDRAGACAHMIDNALTLVEMNYFDVDCGHAGKTEFLGVKFVHRIPRRFPSFECLCEERNQGWRSLVLDKSDFNAVLENIKRVDDNRARAGWVSLGS